VLRYLIPVLRSLMFLTLSGMLSLRRWLRLPRRLSLRTRQAILSLSAGLSYILQFGCHLMVPGLRLILITIWLILHMITINQLVSLALLETVPTSGYLEIPSCVATTLSLMQGALAWVSRQVLALPNQLQSK